jgi:hypothetical protein
MEVIFNEHFLGAVGIIDRKKRRLKIAATLGGFIGSSSKIGDMRQRMNHEPHDPT